MNELLRSEKLKKAIVHYFNNHIELEQRDEIKRKFFFLVEKWKREMEKNNYDDFKEICIKIENDPKFKLPWPVYEIIKAIRFFVKTFKIVDKKEFP